jgi:hypothetical protein
MLLLIPFVVVAIQVDNANARVVIEALEKSIHNRCRYDCFASSW